jgi:protein-L-isoaspartate O-methyltransferase
LDFSEYSVFEFGSGCSTLFWAKRVKKIISVEDNKKWHEKIRDLAKSGIPNLDYLFTENENEYAGYLSQYAEPFDIIIIDGVWRGRCAENAVAHIKKHGGKLLVLDNSDWYPNTVKFIRKELDWLQVDLHGFGPINNYTWTTSIFFNRNSKDNLIFPSIAHSQHWINHRAEDDLAGDRK